MSSRLARSPLPALAVGLGLLSLTPSCLAAGPVKGGRYAGKWSTGSRKGDRYIAFNVDDQGKAFVSDPRVVFQGSEIAAPCTASPWDLGGVQREDVSGSYTTLSDGAAVRIRPNGSFSLGDTRAGLRLAGRFARSGRSATGTFRVACVKRGTFSVRFTGQRHLAVGTCSPPRTATLADDGHSRVYRETYVYDPIVGASVGYDSGAVIYGCDRATQHRWVLAGDDTSEGPSGGLLEYYGCAEFGGPVALAGSFMAIGWESVCQAGLGGSVRIVDVQTGAVVLLNRQAVVTPSGRLGAFKMNSVKALVLAPSGSAAWIVCAAPLQANSPCEVVDELGFGPNTLLDQGNQIDPKSLTLDGAMLSWRNGDETKTATLG